MGSHVEREKQKAMQFVSVALELEATGQCYKAYTQYLVSVQFMIGHMILDAETLSSLSDMRSGTTALEYLMLCVQCIERLKHLIPQQSEVISPISDTKSINSNQSLSTLNNSIHPKSAVNNSSSARSPHFNNFSCNSNNEIARSTNEFPLGLITTVSMKRTMSPIELAHQQNRQLLAVHNARVAHNPAASANLSLSLQRRMAENLAIAQQRQAVIEKKRHERIESLSSEAERRLKRVSSFDKQTEQERRQLFIDCLKFEESMHWLAELRPKLSEKCSDLNFVQSFVQAIVWMADHPLTLLLHRYQKSACEELQQSLMKISVDSSGGMKHSVDSSGRQSETTSSPTDSMSSLSLYEPSGEVGGLTSREGIKLNNLIRKELEKVQTYVDCYEGMLTSVYPELSDSRVETVLKRSIHLSFYTPNVYQSMLQLYRLLTAEKEVTLSRSMRLNALASPLDLGVSRDFTLLSHCQARTQADEQSDTQTHNSLLSIDKVPLADNQSEPYQAAIDELRRLATLHAPIAKLECIVQSSKLVIRCVADHYAQSSKTPGLGADDLLPVLSFIVVKTQQPQLITECSLLMDITQESELMNEEGYCLTSLLTAISYVLTLG